MPIQEAKWNVVSSCCDLGVPPQTKLIDSSALQERAVKLPWMLCLQGRAEMYDTVVGIGVDPRNIAQRIMDVSDVLKTLALAPSSSFVAPPVHADR